MKISVYNLGSYNTKISPMLHQQGELIRSLNVDNFPIGAKKKRPGYVTYLGTPDNTQVDGLFNWRRTNGTQFWNYRFAGGSLFYSQQGTGDWTICGNGTWNSGGTVTHAVAWDNGTVGTTDVMLVSDGIGTIRHSADGTSFTDTAGAPSAAVSLSEYRSRVYVGGTDSFIFWSNRGTVTDWVNDSDSQVIPGEGAPSALFKSQDRLIISKSSGLMFKYDEFNLLDTATDLAPTSQDSIGEIEDFRIYLNRRGVHSYDGRKAQLISNPIERQIFNDKNEGIAGTTFNNAPAVIHKNNYYITIGTVTDDLTDDTISDAVAVYDFQHNEWGNYKLNNKPTAWLSFKDENDTDQLIFGSDDGQCYRIAGTANNDAGATVEAVIEGVLHLGAPESAKEWRFLWASFNPGVQAKMQVAITDTYTKGKKNWKDIGDCSDGVCEFRFPGGSRGKLLFWKVYEASRNERFTFYGFSVEANIIDRK